MQELFIQYKKLLFTIAYQLTGSAADAEDIVQDVFLKVCDVKPHGLSEVPKAYLCKMVVNRYRDLHQSARKQRELYFGEWLPEPVPTAQDTPFDSLVREESLYYGMLVLLERLSPLERAVFVLREAIGFEYADIAGITRKSEVNCRKLFSRAKGKMGLEEDQPVQLQTASEEWVRQFMEALRQNKVDSVVELLAKDVLLISDGGGKAFAAVHPVASRELVSRFLLGIMQQGLREDKAMLFDILNINGQKGLVVRSDAGIEVVALVQTEGDTLRNIYLVRNPDKLRLF
ncbi:RNA polymerase sigma factor SigJ [Paenibacillus albidus]|uniref:RNA polymerase sigma factor SigJ n=1 Tax=Paenibacillus albidus TaxID=2041023 RepID=A0A917CAH2_9BACL|nr:sigma-70 family RNA polymerase sigma factor [Paenibacillus albidus]GGF79461.1 RNA polymerase sigma factor SigJ [Paenibacillus albidus]